MIPRLAPSLLFLLFTLLTQSAIADRPHNIFDDDWTPPKPSTTPRSPTIVKPPTPKPEDPATNVTPPTVAPKETAPLTPPTLAPAARLAVPTSAAQAAVRKVMKEVFAEQLADRSISARRKLTTALLAQADKSNDALVDQFVLLAAAIDSAVDAVDLPAAIRAADKMSEKFEVEGLSVKSEAALHIGPKSVSPDQAAENVIAAIELSDELARVDDYVIAIRVCSALQPQTAGSAPLRSLLQQHIRDLGAQRDAAERFARDLAKLSASPNDPAANLAAGKYVCFVKGDWENGLPMLAKSSDAALKTLAAEELIREKSPEATLQTADHWWDTSGKQAYRLYRSSLIAHAAAIYRQLLDKSSGLQKTKIEQRLEEASRLLLETQHYVPVIVVEALIDGASTLHVTPGGIYWKSHGAAKPGLHDGRNELTFVNGVSWKPAWSQPGDRGDDRSNVFPLKIGDRLDFQAVVVGCADAPHTEKIESRDPIHAKLDKDEFVVNIPDSQPGAKWYRVRIFHKP